MQASPRRRTAAAAAATALVLALAGCSDGDAKPTSASSQETTSASAGDSASASPSDSASDSQGTSTGSAAPEPTGVIGSRKFTVTGTYTQTRLVMRFDLVELKRRGDLLQLVANVTNTSTDKTQDLRWQVASRFDSGTYRTDLKSSGASLAGVVLTDIAAKKRYLVAADSAQECVCSANLSSTFIGAGQTAQLTATYAAPPESTTKLDVDVPSLSTFRDAPLS